MQRTGNRLGLRGGFFAVGLGFAMAVWPGGTEAAGAGPAFEPPKAWPLMLVQKQRDKGDRGEKREKRGQGQGPDLGRAVPFIDSHLHVLGHLRRGDDYGGAGGAAVGAMDRYQIVRGIIMPPPLVAGKQGRHDHEELLGVARQYPGRFAVLGGGGSLNVMLHQAVAQAASKGAVDDALKARFAARAEKILADGAIGFGEMAALHFSLRDGHPFMMAAPDHPLFLLLAEIAQRHRVPIDLHMEAVAADRAIPEQIRGAPNPERLPANIGALERLLGHAPGAVIIWDHLGWDNTGERTVALSRRLLQAHPNLVMNFKVARASQPANRVLRRGAGLGDDWLDLIVEFPDRFLVGSDIKPRPPGAGGGTRETADGVSRLLGLLPADAARRIAIDNPKRVFRLD